MTTSHDWLVALGTSATALLALAALWKLTGSARRRTRSVFQRANRALDVVLGQPEIPDPDRPGEVLRPAIPDIGVRMTRQESLLEQVVLGAVEDARYSARAAADSATAAAQDLATARALAESGATRITELAIVVEDLTSEVAGMSEALVRYHGPQPARRTTDRPATTQPGGSPCP